MSAHRTGDQHVRVSADQLIAELLLIFVRCDGVQPVWVWNILWLDDPDLTGIGDHERVKVVGHRVQRLEPFVYGHLQNSG